MKAVADMTVGSVIVLVHVALAEREATRLLAARPRRTDRGGLPRLESARSSSEL
jgi:hypothetical protein